ncbi:MAG: hypothetical protein QW158_08255 [Nitrososphaerales archaeon]
MTPKKPNTRYSSAKPIVILKAADVSDANAVSSVLSRLLGVAVRAGLQLNKVSTTAAVSSNPLNMLEPSKWDIARLLMVWML